MQKNIIGISNNVVTIALQCFESSNSKAGKYPSTDWWNLDYWVPIKSIIHSTKVGITIDLPLVENSTLEWWDFKHCYMFFTKYKQEESTFNWQLVCGSYRRLSYVTNRAWLNLDFFGFKFSFLFGVRVWVFRVSKF